MKLTIVLKKGDDVFALLKDSIFINRWSKLAEAAQKVTVQQEFAFVGSWYHHYKESYTPLLICGYDEENTLIGLIPMCISQKDNSIAYAGTWQAEYRGWLCDHAIDDVFIIQALITLKKSFDMKVWDWGWLPSGTNIDWMKSPLLKKENIFFDFQEQDSPLLDVLDEDKIIQLKKSRSTKNKINRFKRIGDFHIERIKTKEAASEIFSILEKQCDFRQMAANQWTPYASDPNKRLFDLDRFDHPESVHLSVLRSNGEIIAFNLGECDDKTVFLGILGYDPTKGKNSPGTILLIYLADLIKEEGYQYFDLTPGGNDYKERFGNTTHKLYLPTVFFTKKAYFKYTLDLKVRSIIKNVLQSFKIDPKKLKTKFTKQNMTGSDASHQPLNLTNNLYKINIDQLIISPESKNLVKKNNYSDLLNYDKEETVERRSNLFSQALRKFNSDETFYSFSQDEKLIKYVWLTAPSKIPKYITDQLSFEIPANTILLYDYYHSEAQFELDTPLIKNVLHDLAIDSTFSVYTLVPKELIAPQGLDQSNIFDKIDF